MKTGLSFYLFKAVMDRIAIISDCYREKTDTMLIRLKNGIEFKIRLLISENSYPKTIKEVILKNTSSLYTVILTTYMTKQTAEICKDAGFGYMDLSGNCLISCQSIHIEISGNANENKTKRGLKSIYERSSVVSSIILRTMLADTNKKWQLKALSEAAGCSIGQVSKVKDFLLNHDLAEHGRYGIALTDPKTLMQEWANVYTGDHFNRVGCYTTDSISAIEDKIGKMQNETGIACLLSGFSGGARYQPVVRYNKVHVLIRNEDFNKAVDYLGLKEVNSGANVIFMLQPDHAFQVDSRKIDGIEAASPVQIYLDCMGIKGRGEEMAEAVLEKEICK